MEQISTSNDNERQTPVSVRNTKTKMAPRDCTDFAPRPYAVSNLDIWLLLSSLFIHCLDVGTDVNVAYQHYASQEYVFFYATIAVVLIPSFINTLVSWHMYRTDRISPTVDKNTYRDPFQTKWCWLRVTLMALLLAPLVRFWDSLVYAIKCRNAKKRGDKLSQEKFYRLMLKEDADSALLRIFEFLESAPQQVIQLSGVLLGTAVKTSVYHIMFSVVSSFVCMALSLLSYQRAIRFAQEDKSNITLAGSITIFIWQLMMATSRIVALSALSSVCWPATIILVVVHWILMLLMLSYCEDLNFCSNHIPKPKWYHRLGDFLFDASLSLAYIFLYITPGEGPTRSRYALFYSIIGFENIAAVIIWTRLVDPQVSSLWYYYVILVAVIGCFLAGIITMISYYACIRNKKSLQSTYDTNPSEQELSTLKQITQTAL